MKKLSRILLAAVLCMTIVLGVCACEPTTPTPPPSGKQYEVIFSRNCDDNGVVEPEVQKVKDGEKATKPADPVRRGYEVEGWYTDEACTAANKFDFDTPITAETILYAHWVEAVTRYTVTFNYNGGTGTPASAVVVSGQKLEKPADPTLSGKAFGGWYLDSGLNNVFSFDSLIEGNTTLYAKWVNSVTVTYNLGYTGAENKTETIAEGSIAPNLAVTRTGYIFAGWFENAACTTVYKYTAINAATTLYAKWVAEGATMYTYTFDFNYTGAPTAATVSVVEGGVVAVPDLTGKIPSGKAFTGWYNEAACTTAVDVYTVASGNKTVYAGWRNALAVVFDPNYSGAVANTVDMTAGQTIAKPADPVRTGYTFVGWSTAPDKDPDYTFGAAIGSATVTLYAQWSKVYVFEAEDVDVSEVAGWGFSGDAKGANVIIADEGGKAEASNGYYTYCLNSPNLTLDFKFTSDREAKKVKFTIRLSAEIKDISITSGTSTADSMGKFTMNVNGTPLDYGVINFTSVPAQSSGDVLKFKDYTFEVDLKKGENHILLIVDNESNYQGGTMKAIAPMVDCIKLETSAKLEFTPVFGQY